MTFKDLLDSFFQDDRLKATFNVLLGNIGVPAADAAALAAIILFREYILDGVYYPSGGMQTFSDMIVEKFQEFGGEIVLSQEVIKILTRDNKVQAVHVDNSKEIKAKVVVSNADATQTFEELLDSKVECYQNVSNLTASVSAFMVYLGLNRNLKQEIDNVGAIAKCFTYDMNTLFRDSFEDLINGKTSLLTILFPSFHNSCISGSASKSTMELLVFSKYGADAFWKENKEIIASKIITIAEKMLFPLDSLIELKEIATPATFHRYTLNREGACYGWEPTLSQIKPNVCPIRSCMEGLYIVGHWSTGSIAQSGIPGVAISGRKVAEQVLINGFGKEWGYGIFRI